MACQDELELRNKPIGTNVILMSGACLLTCRWYRFDSYTCHLLVEGEGLERVECRRSSDQVEVFLPPPHSTMPCSPVVFQLPIPTLLFLIPPSHLLQWVVRSIFLGYTFFLAIPLILLLVPLSITLQSINPRWAILSIHPDNLPPKVTFGKAVRRGVVVYTVGTVIWAITGIGNAPDSTDDVSRWITRYTCRLVELFTSRGSQGRLEWTEESVEPIDERYRLGAMREGQAVNIGMFALRHVPSFEGGGSEGRPRAILFFAGGGYVTGTPLGHPFVFSLARLLPHGTGDGGYTVYAPSVRKSLDRARSFPIPLLDALAAYQHLRDRYPAEDITIMGDSAGGGLVWSLTAYLAILDSVVGHGGRLGIPGRAILISVSVNLALITHTSAVAGSPAHRLARLPRPDRHAAAPQRSEMLHGEVPYPPPPPRPVRERLGHVEVGTDPVVPTGSLARSVGYPACPAETLPPARETPSHPYLAFNHDKAPLAHGRQVARRHFAPPAPMARSRHVPPAYIAPSPRLPQLPHLLVLCPLSVQAAQHQRDETARACRNRRVVLRPHGPFCQSRKEGRRRRLGV